MPMNILQTVQQVAQNCMKAADLTDLAYGTVASVNPLSVEVNTPTRLILPAAALELTYMAADHYVDMTAEESTSHVLMRYGLSVGEKVIMLKTMSGQNYLIISRVVSGDDNAGVT